MNFDHRRAQKKSYHMTFEGSPGTGKSTMADIARKILEKTGLSNPGKYKKVASPRNELVGQYIGETGIGMNSFAC